MKPLLFSVVIASCILGAVTGQTTYPNAFGDWQVTISYNAGQGSTNPAFPFLLGGKLSLGNSELADDSLAGELLSSSPTKDGRGTWRHACTPYYLTNEAYAKTVSAYSINGQFAGMRITHYHLTVQPDAVTLTGEVKTEFLDLTGATVASFTGTLQGRPLLVDVTQDFQCSTTSVSRRSSR